MISVHAARNPVRARQQTHDECPEGPRADDVADSPGTQEQRPHHVTWSYCYPRTNHAIFKDNKSTSMKAWRSFLIRKLMLANNKLTSFTGGSNPSKNLASLN